MPPQSGRRSAGAQGFKGQVSRVSNANNVRQQCTRSTVRPHFHIEGTLLFVFNAKILLEILDRHELSGAGRLYEQR